MKVPRRRCCTSPSRHHFSTTARRREIRDLRQLPLRNLPNFLETRSHDLLSLQWPAPPRNILLVKKNDTPAATDALLEFAQHVHSTYPSISFILEPAVASTLHDRLPFPIYAPPPASSIDPSLLPQKVDITATFGGDGTILHAASLFSTSTHVPPILAFSMGTLGFLGEWKFREYKRAFREVYMSGAPEGGSRASVLDRSKDQHADPSTTPVSDSSPPTSPSQQWPSLPGLSLGNRPARVLLRSRLRITLYAPSSSSTSPPPPPQTLHALNDLTLHRSPSPHLTSLSLSLSSPPKPLTSRTPTTSSPPKSPVSSLTPKPTPLTTLHSDGLILSTPTGSTAYSLSAGGSIIHPLVNSITLTPICPRSLSFRPLVLPGDMSVHIELEAGDRSGRVMVGVDGVEVEGGLVRGGRVVVGGEGIRKVGGGEGGGAGAGDGQGGGAGEGEGTTKWVGGVPCLMRAGGRADSEGVTDDGWVVGLNGLLKFNYPFGEEG